VCRLGHYLRLFMGLNILRATCRLAHWLGGMGDIVLQETDPIMNRVVVENFSQARCPPVIITHK
jgi:hypothetical protein